MIVLDTHVLIWFMTGDATLSSGIRGLLEGRPEDVFVPTVCLWEAVLLSQKGRLQFALQDLGLELREAIRSSRFNEAPLTGDIAVLSRTLEF